MESKMRHCMICRGHNVNVQHGEQFGPQLHNHKNRELRNVAALTTQRARKRRGFVCKTELKTNHTLLHVEPPMTMMPIP